MTPPLDATPRLPGPRKIPLLSNKAGLIRFLRDPIGTLLSLHAEYGGIAALPADDPALIFAFGAEHNRQILSDPLRFHSSGDPPFPMAPGSSVERLNNALTSMNGDQHRRHRRLMMPVFGKAAIELYRDDMAALVERFAQRLRPGATLDVQGEMIELSLVVAMRCLFGLDVETGAAELGRMGVQTLRGLSSVWNALLPFDVPGLPYARYMRHCERTEQRIRALIRERRRTADRGRDVLSILIRAHDDDGASLTDDELVGHANVLFIAAHETTAFTLGWTLFLLATHPAVYADLEGELRAALGGDAPSVEALARLPLLDAVVRESMRLMPAVPYLFPRIPPAPVALGSHTAPAGVRIILSPFVTHRAPGTYAEPRRFLPRRWETISPGPYEYMPFGAGPRLCIGAGFASQLLRIALAILVQRFRFSLPPNAEISRKVHGNTLGAKHGIPMRVERQDRRFASRPEVPGDIHELVDLAD